MARPVPLLTTSGSESTVTDLNTAVALAVRVKERIVTRNRQNKNWLVYPPTHTIYASVP